MTNIIDDCFHGRLDRRIAEERLSLDGRSGAFLLRESDRKTGSYVLSYYGRTGVNHFKITNAYGSYFIGGRQFDSLSDLINYYSSTCDLLTDERLMYPVSPPETVAAQRRIYVSILPYTKLANSDELSFKKGDMFLLLNDLGDGWLWVRDVRTGQSGMVFSQLVEEIQEDIETNEIFPWFHAKLGKAEAVSKLAEAGPGSFLIRPSDNSPGNYTLFYHVGTTIQRFLIIRDSENRYIMGGKCFDSLGQIVELYQREQVIEGHVLRYPITTTLSRTENQRDTAEPTSTCAKGVKEPEDIYNTVKISREAAKKKQSSEVMGWLNLKKDDMQKKWKNYYFVLNSRERHLYYYEKPQQTKPKGMIDLSYALFYHVHESLFDWPQCFQLIEKCLPCFTNRFYIRCNDDPPDYERWCKAIKSFTSSNQCNKKRVNTTVDSSTFDARARWNSRSEGVYEEKRSIFLSFITAQSLKISNPYFLISFNHDINIAKTLVKTNPNAIFTEDSHFALENIPSEVRSITVSLHQSKKVKSSMDAPQFNLDLDCLRSEGENLDRWFKLCPLTSATEVLGTLRMRVVYDRDIVMSLSDYAALEDLLCELDEGLVSLFNQFCRRDQITLARSMVNLMRSEKIIVRTLKSLIDREVEHEDDVSTLFRTNSLTLALIESYTRAMSRNMLIKCLKDPIRKLLDDKICCEINPSKLESHNDSQKACENFQNLLDVLDELVSNIYECIKYYPLPVRYLLSCLQRKVVEKWPDEQLIRTRVVSSFIILRLICPTMLNPKQFKLINETPSENAFRNLTLVARCLQSLSNLVETSRSNNSLAQTIITTLDDYNIYSRDISKKDDNDDYSTQTNSILAFILSPQIESWMEVVNPFILKNKIGMIKFVDELCNVEPVDPSKIDESYILKDGNSDGKSSLAEDDIPEINQDLAVIHGICEKYRHKLEEQANVSAPAKKLTAVLTILSKHKQYYLSLKRNMQQQVNSVMV